MKKMRVLTARRGFGGFIQRHTALSLTLLSLLGAGGVAWAVHFNDVFQLTEDSWCDGTEGQEVNAPCDSSNPNDDYSILPDGPLGAAGEDWETIWLNVTDPGGGSTPPTNALAFTWVEDLDEGTLEACTEGELITQTTPFPTRWQGNDTKDTDIIEAPGWGWVDLAPLDKNDLLHGFAAMYRFDVDKLPDGTTTDPDLENVVYFGSDRKAQEGDAQVGFWILKNPIGLLCGGDFAGQHAVGDVLVVTNFTSGGGVGTVNIYKWREAGGPDTGEPDDLLGGGANETHPNLDLLAVQQDCDFIGFNIGPGCGSVATLSNEDGQTPETSPWAFVPKQTGNNPYQPGQYPPQTFFEGGINLDHPDIQLSGCFSGFVAESRASQSLSAQRHDFLLGNFETCGFTITKQVDTDPTKVGDTVTYTITITNTGIASLWPTSIDDSIAGDLLTPSLNTGVSNLVNNCTGELKPMGEPGDSCTITYDYTIPDGAGDPVDNIVTAVYNDVSNGSGTSFEEEADATTGLFTPGVTIDKTGDALSKVGDTVDYTITVDNTSSTGTPDLTCTVTDPMITLGGDAAGFVLATGGQKVLAGSYVVQQGDADPLLNTATVNCTVGGGFGNAVSDSDGHSVDLIAPDFSVTKSCVEEPIQVGASANFRIRIANTGDVPLELHIVDTVLSINTNVTLGVVTGDGVCDELDWSGDPATGCYEIEDGVIVDVPGEFENNVDVTFTLDQNLYPLPNTDTKSAGDACTVEQGGATRTLGFWKTHGSDGEAGFPSPVERGYTCHVARDHIGFPIDIGWKVLQDCEDVFGVFMANPGKNADGSKRQPKACSAKPQAAWVYLAATLNQALDNGAALDPALYQALYNALAGNDFKAIKDATGPVNAYNESGDDVAIIDNDGAIIPNADPNGVRAAADLTAADCP